ncbi:MAG: hypothetical protein NT154_03485 [Verrucomicrobia bacterium]|nr:hypothetical protein [Verrucomicrobiota bacterium]
MNGTVTCGERVVIVEVQSGRVHLKTGRISSADSGSATADNRNTIVVWGDQRLQSFMEGADDAYERAFEVSDIHVLKEQEAYSLGDPDTAQNWFGAIYQDDLVTKINRALKRLKGKSDQQSRSSQESELN